MVGQSPAGQGRSRAGERCPRSRPDRGLDAAFVRSRGPGARPGATRAAGADPIAHRSRPGTSPGRQLAGESPRTGAHETRPSGTFVLAKRWLLRGEKIAPGGPDEVRCGQPMVSAEPLPGPNGLLRAAHGDRRAHTGGLECVRPRPRQPLVHRRLIGLPGQARGSGRANGTCGQCVSCTRHGRSMTGCEPGRLAPMTKASSVAMLSSAMTSVSGARPGSGPTKPG